VYYDGLFARAEGEEGEEGGDAACERGLEGTRG
jgi:hypothetical protein